MTEEVLYFHCFLFELHSIERETNQDVAGVRRKSMLISQSMLQVSKEK